MRKQEEARIITQLTFICSKSTIEALKRGFNFVQS